MTGHIRTLGVVAVVVMVALSGGVAAAAFAPTTTQSTVSQTDASAALQEAGNASVTFDDQTTPNETVTVQNVTLPEGGYVALHDSSVLDDANASIEADSVVGVSDYLEPGTHGNVTVTLYENVPGETFENATVNGTQTFVAMAHQETSEQPTTTPGNNTTTTTTTDDNATTTTDDNATTTTTTDGNATTTDGNATTTTTTTTTDETTGTTTTESPAAANDGTNGNTTDGNATAMFGAAQQQDDSPTFDFVTSDGEEDGPYLVDGQPVTDSAEVTFEDGETEPGDGTTPGDDGTTDQGDDGATGDDDEAASGDLVVGNLSAPAYVTPGSNVTVNATVTNEGGESLEQDVAFRLAGGNVDVVMHQSVTVDAGETTNVTFEVDTTDVPEREYIHGVTTENSSAFAQITVTNDSAVAIPDQNATDNVTVEDVFVPEGGYVAVHNSNVINAPVESVVGVSDYLEPGYHENVTVTLYDDVAGATFQNDSVSDAQTLVAMTHQETSANATDGNATNTFDFVTSDGDEDGPYLVDGQPVVDTAIVTPADAETNETA